jgi:hypothetical protein
MTASARAVSRATPTTPVLAAAVVTRPEPVVANEVASGAMAVFGSCEKGGVEQLDCAVVASRHIADGRTDTQRAEPETAARAAAVRVNLNESVSRNRRGEVKGANCTAVNVCSHFSIILVLEFSNTTRQRLGVFFGVREHDGFHGLQLACCVVAMGGHESFKSFGLFLFLGRHFD